MAGGREFIQGLKDGYNFVDSIYEREDRRKRRSEEEAMRDADREREIQRQEAHDARAAETHNMRKESHQQGIIGRKQQLENDKSRSDYYKQQQELSKFQLGRQKQQEKAQKHSAKLQGIATRLDAGLPPTAEELSLMYDMGIDVDRMINPEYQQDLENILGTISGEGGPRAINNPQVLESVNRLLGNQVQKGIGEKTADGKTIVGKKIIGFVPAKKPGHFAVALGVQVKDKDGKISMYQAPATEGRSSSQEDGLVIQIPLEGVMDDLLARQQFTQLFNQPNIRPLIESALVEHGVPRTKATAKQDAVTERQKMKLDATEVRDVRKFIADQINLAAKTQSEATYTGEQLSQEQIEKQAIERAIRLFGKETVEAAGVQYQQEETSQDHGSKLSTKEEVDRLYSEMNL